MKIAIEIHTLIAEVAAPVLVNPAYLDPGSGSFILQLLLASLLGSIFLIKTYWRKITRFFRRDQATDDDDEASQE